MSLTENEDLRMANGEYRVSMKKKIDIKARGNVSVLLSTQA